MKPFGMELGVRISYLRKGKKKLFILPIVHSGMD